MPESEWSPTAVQWRAEDEVFILVYNLRCKRTYRQLRGTAADTGE